MHAQRARFLVFVKVHDLFDESHGTELQTIIDDYHNKLKELVGEGGYEEFLNSLHFVFTHNDKTYSGETYTTEQITYRCEELTFDLFAASVANEYLPQFVMRMGEAHTLVDYSTQTSEELRQSIESSSAVPADTVMTVQVDTNEMNRQCEKLLEAEQRALEIKNRERSDDWGKAVTEVLKHKGLVHSAQEQKAALVAKKEDNLRATEEAVDLGASIRANLPTLEANVTQKKATVEQVGSQAEVFQKHLEEIETVSLRIDHARLNKGFMKDTYSFDSCVMLPKEAVAKPPLVLVVDNEPRDATLRAHMQNSGSLVPFKLSTAAECALDVVWFNSHLDLAVPGKFQQQVVQLDVETGLFKVMFSSERPFKVLIYTAVAFAQTQAAASIRKHYGGILEHEEQGLATVEAETAKAKRDLQEAGTRAEAHRATVTELEAEILRAEKDVESKAAAFDTACDGANAALAKFEQDWSDARIDPHVAAANSAQTNEISLISAVARIFEQNDLETNLQQDVAKYAELSNTMHDAFLKAREELHSASCIVPEGVPGQPMPQPEPEPSGRWM